MREGIEKGVKFGAKCGPQKFGPQNLKNLSVYGNLFMEICFFGGSKLRMLGMHNMLVHQFRTFRTPVPYTNFAHPVSHIQFRTPVPYTHLAHTSFPVSLKHVKKLIEKLIDRARLWQNSPKNLQRKISFKKLET